MATAGEAILAELEATRKAHDSQCVERRVARSNARPVTAAEKGPNPAPARAGSALPTLPLVFLGLLTLFTVAGPLLMYAAIRGGPSPNWPPDRALEWVVIAAVPRRVPGPLGGLPDRPPLVADRPPRTRGRHSPRAGCMRRWGPAGRHSPSLSAPHPNPKYMMTDDRRANVGPRR